MKLYGISNKSQKGRGSFPNSNQGEFYSGSSHNGMWEYHCWTPSPFEARTFRSIEAARMHKKSHSIPGRVVRVD